MTQPRHRLRTLGALALSFCLCACRATSGSPSKDSTHTTPASPAAAQTQAQTPRVIVSPPGRDPVEVSVEVVKTPEDRQRGLMYRKHLEARAGMLFIFDQPQQLTFWMHNTLIPLDMIFITADFRVLGVVENATPLTDDARSVPGQAQYVLEVNAGFARSAGIGPGNSVQYLPGS